jgi:hypothetical protein
MKDTNKVFTGGIVIGATLGLLIGFALGTQYAERIITSLL